MEAIKNVGLIECGNSTVPSLSNDFSLVDGFRLTKVLAKNTSTNQFAKAHYPEAELVEDYGSIIADQSIQLVLVASPENNDLSLVAEALGAGKQVRIL
ncbi:MAG: Gfo/Idh/MocA family oxidoreductase [Flavitalea sp.]